MTTSPLQVLSKAFLPSRRNGGWGISSCQVHKRKVWNGQEITNSNYHNHSSYSLWGVIKCLTMC